MRSKYEQDSFAVFQGTIFSATTNNGYVEVLTTDGKLAKKFNFLLDGDIYYKDISPYEVTEYYEQTFEAKFKGKIVGIMRGDDNKVDIQPEPTDFTYEDLIKFGFKQVEKGVYEKTLPISELTDIHAIKDDLLEYAKKDFDENNKSRLKLLKEKYNISIAKFNLLKNDFLNFPKCSEIAGELSSRRRIFTITYKL